MWDEEKAHLAKFNELIPKYKVRPSALLPLWNVAGYALGKNRIFCVKSMKFFQVLELLYWVKKQLWHVQSRLKLLLANIIISEIMLSMLFCFRIFSFYSQLRDLMEHADQIKDKDLIKTIKKFRDDEAQHHDTGLANNAEQVKNFILCFL